jgi:long-chain acyl-CoA synthetase
MGFSRTARRLHCRRAIGPELFQFYRLARHQPEAALRADRASVYITLQPDGEVYPDTVGKPAPDVDIKIADNGEVLFKSPGCSSKPLQERRGNQYTKTPDGWCHRAMPASSDQRGHSRSSIAPRTSVAPQQRRPVRTEVSENRIKFYPEVRRWPSARARLRHDAHQHRPTSVGNWAERNNVSYASYQELAANRQVYDIIAKRVDELNKALAEEPQMAASQIRRFLILHKELDADDGELTRTLKVRRTFIADRYGPLIAALYDGSKMCHVATEMTFEDGRKGVVEGDLRIVDMQTYASRAPEPLREAAE